MTNKEWFPKAKFGLMVHFGLYALLGGEYRGKVMDGIGEWAQSYFKIPIKEYEKLKDIFNPIYFNAEEWVLLAKEAGMEYIVVTAKHHEGFALFDSAVDDYNVMHTPFGRDMIKELAEACKKHGIRLGLYYSQEIDWHEPNGGNYSSGRTWGDPSKDDTAWTNDWDFPDNAKKNYTQCFEDKIKPQIREILTKYGDLCLIWCDTPHDITDAQSKELYDMIKTYQPDILVNSRIGNGFGDYCSCDDNETDFDQTKNKMGLCECPATINDTWGFKPTDQNFKSADEIIAIKEKLNAHGINYLLNVGPDALGRIPAKEVAILKEVGAKLKNK